MKRVFILVDCQVDFFRGSLGFADALALEEKIVAKLNECKEKNIRVVCTLDTHDKDYLQTQEGVNLPIEHCIKNTAGWELYGAIKEAAINADAIMVEKDTFPSAKLIDTLRDIDEISRELYYESVEQIEFGGVVTDMCVISNAIIAKAALPNARIRILSELCSSNNMDAHHRALEVMAGLQMEVV